MKNDGQDNLKRECTAAKFPILKTQNQINTMLKLLSWNRRSSGNTEIYTHTQWEHSYLVEKEGMRGEGRWTWQVVMVCVGEVWERLKPDEETVRSPGEKGPLNSSKSAMKSWAHTKNYTNTQLIKGDEAGNSNFREHVNRKWTVGARGSELWHLVLMLVLPSPCTSEKCDRSGSSSSRSFRL